MYLIERGVERVIEKFRGIRSRSLQIVSEAKGQENDELQQELHSVCGKAVALLALGQRIVPEDPLYRFPKNPTFGFRFPDGQETVIEGIAYNYLGVRILYNPTPSEREFFKKIGITEKTISIGIDKWYEEAYAATIPWRQTENLSTWLPLKSLKIAPGILGRLNALLGLYPTEIGVQRSNYDNQGYYQGNYWEWYSTTPSLNAQ